MKKGRRIDYEIVAEFECDKHDPLVKVLENVDICIFNGPPLCPECEEEMGLTNYFKKVK
jgi:hypothetical protein